MIQLVTCVIVGITNVSIDIRGQFLSRSANRHIAVIKNDALYIYGGVQTYGENNSTNKTAATLGISMNSL